MVLLSEIQKFKMPVADIAPPIFFTDAELQTAGQHRATLLFDIECYSNYFLAAFKCYQTGKIVYFERSPSNDFNAGKFAYVMQNFLTVGFNSWNYDIPLAWAAIAGHWTTELKAISNLIVTGVSNDEIQKQYPFEIQRCNHIDLQGVAPGVQASLKQYGARMHVKRLQDLPVSQETALTEQESTTIKYYCFNDLDLTAWLYKYLEQPSELRKQLSQEYRIDLRSKSDAQISEAVVANEIGILTGQRPKRPSIDPEAVYQYQPPLWLRFASHKLQDAFYEVCNAEFTINEFGKIVMPPNVAKLKMKIGQSVYQMGIGGLHSCEKRMTYYTNEDYVLIDRDVESYYPAIILNNNLYPDHIGEAFVSIFRKLVEKRMAAKKLGDKSKSESLKIAINGAFGKLGSKWSCLYSPNVLIQVTLTGQLALLMLIELLEWHSISVVSGNTDGIVIRCPQAKIEVMNGAIANWERVTGFKTEETRYRSIHCRDVNNYIAITTEGKVKSKGAYSFSRAYKDAQREALMKNPKGEILVEAIYQFLANNVPIEKTIKSCRDLTKFIFARKVKGGAAKDKIYLGKTIRWYMRLNEFGSICYIQSGNRVPESEGGYPVMVIPDTFPNDIDYGWYIREANKMLCETGYADSVQLPLFA